MAVDAVSDAPQLLAFIKIGIEAQAEELRNYLRTKGADVPEEASDQGLLEDMKQVIDVCDACFADTSDADVESVLNSIVSIITLDSIKGHDQLITAFCRKLCSCASRGPACLKALRLLASSLRVGSPSRYDVFHSLLTVAGSLDQVESVFTSVSHLETELGDSVTLSQKQSLLRLIYRELLNNKRSESASRVMVELLSTYTEQNASQAVEEASSCVLAAVADPDILLLDYLIALKPIKQLSGSPLFRLLEIFVEGNLADYLAFHSENQQLIAEWGLDHERNIVKMQKLTFLQLAQSQQDLTFDTLENTLQLSPENVEAFLIEVLQTRLVRARIDQLNGRVHVSYAAPRTFGERQWQQLRQTLTDWRASIATSRANIERVVAASDSVRNDIACPI